MVILIVLFTVGLLYVLPGWLIYNMGGIGPLCVFITTLFVHQLVNQWSKE